jgi:hypothetical protein
MSSENQDKKSKNNDKTELVISSKKYSTLVDFREDFYENKEELLEKKSEEELKVKEEEEQVKQKVLEHWSKLLLREPPRRRTCHTSFMHDGYFYVIGGIDITEQKQDDIFRVKICNPEPKQGGEEQNNNSDNKSDNKANDEQKGVWEKVDVLGEKMGRIAYHAGDVVSDFYYIVGGQDEHLNILNSIQKFNISQSEMGEKNTNIEVESNLQITDVQKRELIKKVLHILRAKVKDKTESDRIFVLETELEKELLKHIDEEDLISREKTLIEEIEKDLKTEDINKLTDSSVDIEKTTPEDLDKVFRPELITESVKKIDEKLLKIYFPPLESHTVNANGTSLVIYGGMSKNDYNRHVYIFDTQNNTAKNLTEQLEKDKLPPPRQDHAAVIYNGSLYVYGGIGPDNKIYDDMWKFDLTSNTWEEIKTKAQQNKEERRKQRLEQKQANNEEIETEDEENEDEDEDPENPDIRPKGRSGHSMVLVGSVFYIFGGKTGLIKESNEVWRFIPDQLSYECVHEILLEQFTKEELQKISSENKKDVQKFRWLTRSDIEKRTNPSFNDNKKDEEKKKNKKNVKTSQSPSKNQKNTKNQKNAKNKKTDKTDNKIGQNKDIEGKYSDQVLCRPNVVKMRKTLIFTSDPEKIKEGLNTLSKDEKEKITQNMSSIKGEIPEPRDGQSVCVNGTDLYIFGGDRFKFPFNDLFVLDTKEIPLLKVKEDVIKKIQKEKEKEEKKLREQKEKEEQEEEEKLAKIEEEKQKEKKDENDDNGENGENEDNENEGKNKSEGKAQSGEKSENKDNKKDDNKSSKKEENQTSKKDENQTSKKDENKIDKKEAENKTDDLKLLRELLTYS